jgi:glyoxylase-like metal-dependent hydrolase (beta-lactamase superfamily II)
MNRASSTGEGKMIRGAFAWTIGIFLIIGNAAFSLAQDQGVREITQVTGNLYRARAGNAFTVFVVTPEGIILSDPISTDYAKWLKSEFAQRFSLPVKYVLYTHHHWDHASGGAVFADTAEFVGHKTMPGILAMPPADTPLSANAAQQDSDGDGQVAESEAQGDLKARFRLYDANGDGKLSGAEIKRGPLSEVYPPQTLYSDRKTVSLGGKTVEMLYVGTEAEDMSLLRFPEEKAIFLVDFISLKRAPYRTLPGIDLDDLFSKIRMVESLDFDIAIGGHGSIGNKSDVTAFGRYLEELRAAVAEGIAAGKTLAELQKSITMDKYREWENYEAWRAENVEGMYMRLAKKP